VAAVQRCSAKLGGLFSDLISAYDSAGPSEQEQIRTAILNKPIEFRKAAKRGEISEDDYDRAQKQITAFNNQLVGARKSVRKTN
jgi:hypothetical protein